MLSLKAPSAPEDEATAERLLRADEERAAAAAAAPLPEGSMWAMFGGTELEPLLAYTTLIDAKWLLELAESGGVLPAWQNVPAVAIVSLADLRASTMQLQLPVAQMHSRSPPAWAALATQRLEPS